MRPIYERKHGIKVKEDGSTEIDLVPSKADPDMVKVNLGGKVVNFPAKTALSALLASALKHDFHLTVKNAIYNSKGGTIPLTDPISKYAISNAIEFEAIGSGKAGDETKLILKTAPVPVKKEAVALTQEELYELENINFQVSYMKEILQTEVSPNLKESLSKEDIKTVIEKLQKLI